MMLLGQVAMDDARGGLASTSAIWMAYFSVSAVRRPRAGSTDQALRAGTHHDEGNAVFGGDVVDRDDVGVIEGGGGAAPDGGAALGMASLSAGGSLIATGGAGVSRARLRLIPPSPSAWDLVVADRAASHGEI
jgi:hypothetical protein